MNTPRMRWLAAAIAVPTMLSGLLIAFALPRWFPDQTIARIGIPAVVARAWEVNIRTGGNIDTGRRRLLSMGNRARAAVGSMVASPTPAVRAEAYSLLGEIANAQDGPLIAAGITEADWKTRRGAIIGLGHLSSREHSRALSDAFRGEPRPDLRALIVLAAGRSGRVIADAAIDPDWSVRRAHVEALSDVEPQTFLSQQSVLFRDPDPRVRRTVAVRSVRSGTPRILPEIQADPYRHVSESGMGSNAEPVTKPNRQIAPSRDLVVSTLADDGAGSLRWAIEQPGPRRIRFAVQGRISLRSFLVVREPYVVIDGGDAAAGGIEIVGFPLVVRGTHHVTIRGISISRIGEGVEVDPEYADALSINAGRLPWTAPYYDGEDAVTADVSVEHCSLLDAIDENLEIYQEGSTTPVRNVLVRGNVIAFGRHRSTHPKGDHSRGLLMGQNLQHVRIEANVFLNNGGRNPFASVAGHAEVAIVRNVVRGWTEQGIGVEALPAASRVGVVRIENNVLVSDFQQPAALDLQGHVCVDGRPSAGAMRCEPDSVDVRLSSNRLIRADELHRLGDEHMHVIAEAGSPAGAAARWFPEVRR